MNEHTPGPWNVVETSETMIEVCSPWSTENTPEKSSGWGSHRGIHICEIEHQGDNPCVSKRAALANAHLIAAAPDLLAACQRYLRDLMADRDCHYDGATNEHGEYSDDEDRMAVEQYDREIDELRALLQRAHGDDT